MSAGMSQKRFLFDTSFDGANGELIIEPPGGEPPAPQFGEEDLEQARAEGVAAGREAALQEARLQAEEALVRTEQQVGRALETLLQQWTATERQLAEEATEATGLMLRKLFPVLAETAGLAEIEALIGDCLTRVKEEPRIVVRVSAEQIEPITARIDAVASQRAYDGKVVVIADDDLAAGDALVEWADGGAQRDSARLLAEMDAAIARSKILLGLAGPAASEEAEGATPTTPATEGSSHG